MIGVEFTRSLNQVVCLGAHPDDIEVGAAGLLRRLAERNVDTEFVFAIAAGDSRRSDEAASSAKDLLGDRVTVSCAELTDGFLPYSHAAEVKEFFKTLPGDTVDLVLAPHVQDRHQDHRFVAELAHQIFRKQMILEYEIVKLEGDLGSPSVYVPLSATQMAEKIDHLSRHFPSQHGKPWYDGDMFSGLMRLRGVESLAPDGYAEAFHATRISLG